jgi:RNA polymerase sigma factor (sigma-70 family)
VTLTVQDPDGPDVRACLQGDEAAYARIIRRHEPQVAALMWRLCHDRGTCEELTQDVFVKAYLSLASYRGEAPFGGWLRRIAVRVGFSHCRKASGRPALLPIEAWDQPGREVDRLEPAEAEASLHALLARLKPEERLVLTMLYFEDCSIEEISRRTGWGASRIKMRASRGRDRLREMLERRRLSEG